MSNQDDDGAALISINNSPILPASNYSNACLTKLFTSEKGGFKNTTLPFHSLSNAPDVQYSFAATIRYAAGSLVGSRSI